MSSISSRSRRSRSVGSSSSVSDSVRSAGEGSPTRRRTRGRPPARRRRRRTLRRCRRRVRPTRRRRPMLHRRSPPGDSNVHNSWSMERDKTQRGSDRDTVAKWLLCQRPGGQRGPIEGGRVGSWMWATRRRRVGGESGPRDSITVVGPHRSGGERGMSGVARASREWTVPPWSPTRRR